MDGLPLALEMAAARLRSMTLAELAESIGDLDVLATARRDVDPRHRTVRDLVAWSERLLDDDLRAGSLGFSVFAGPVRARELPAAVPTDRPADTVTRLVDRSLVHGDAGSRRRAFRRPAHDPQLRRGASPRQRRLRRRAAAPRRVVRRRVAEIDDALRTADEPAAMRRFEEIVDEVRAAVRWALDHDVDLAARLAEHAYTAGRSQLRAEVVSWLEDVAGACPSDHPMRPDRPQRPRRRVGVRRAARGGEGDRRRGAGVGRRRLALCALEGLGDIATSTRVGSTTRWRSWPPAVAAAERDDSLYADLATVGLAIGDGYAGRTDAALATSAHGPTCGAPSATAWFEYVTGEVIRELDPAVAISHLDRAEATARVAGNRFLTEVSLAGVDDAAGALRCARRGRGPLRRAARPLRAAAIRRTS